MHIDGEKWACEACVRGHRVSSCRHNDRPLIRINKKGRPYTICCVCRGPCKAREEHSKLNRSKKSDGESDAKSSGKKTAERRRTQPASFPRIAPQPAPLPSLPERNPTIPSPFPVGNSAMSQSRAVGCNPSQLPNPSSGQFLASTQAYPHMSYPIVPPVTLDQTALSQSAYNFQFPDDSLFPEDPSFSDGSLFQDPGLSGFADLDALPEDWSVYFWSA